MRFKTFLEMTPAHDAFSSRLYKITQDVTATSQKILTSPKVNPKDLYTLRDSATDAAMMAGEAPRHAQAQAKMFSLVDRDHNMSIGNWLLGVMRPIRMVCADIQKNPQRYGEMHTMRSKMTSGYHNTWEMNPAVDGNSDLKAIYDKFNELLETLDRYEMEHSELGKVKPANADQYDKWSQARRQARQQVQMAQQQARQAPAQAPAAPEPYQYSAPLLEPGTQAPAPAQKSGWKSWLGR
jgi:hypothetical protein